MSISWVRVMLMVEVGVRVTVRRLTSLPLRTGVRPISGLHNRLWAQDYSFPFDLVRVFALS